MPAKPAWFGRLPEIRAALQYLHTPILDRTVIEQLFGVKRRRAIQILHAAGGYQTGRTFLVERTALLEKLGEWMQDSRVITEQRRRRRLLEDLEQAERAAPARQMRINRPAQPDTPPGILLAPGCVTLEFHEIEELLSQMLWLSKAVLQDAARFEEMLRINRPPGSPDPPAATPRPGFCP